MHWNRVLDGPLVQDRIRPKSKNISPNSERTRTEPGPNPDLIWTSKQAWKSLKVKFGLKHLYVKKCLFISKLRNGPKLGPKFFSNLGPNRPEKLGPTYKSALKEYFGIIPINNAFDSLKLLLFFLDTNLKMAALYLFSSLVPNDYHNKFYFCYNIFMW